MKYGIIIGSHRKKSQSTKVGKYIEGLVDAKTYVLDLRTNPIPLWDDSMWEEGSKLREKWQPYSKELTGCDAFIIVSPEWSGMVPAGLKNFFLYCKTELAHKPALIVTVSSGRGGSYPVAELRMSSYKNTHLCYIPEHVIVRDVENVLNDTEINENDKADAYIKKRIVYALSVLAEYTTRLKGMNIDLKEFPYGM